MVNFYDMNICLHMKMLCNMLRVLGLETGVLVLSAGEWMGVVRVGLKPGWSMRDIRKSQKALWPPSFLFLSRILMCWWAAFPFSPWWCFSNILHFAPNWSTLIQIAPLAEETFQRHVPMTTRTLARLLLSQIMQKIETYRDMTHIETDTAMIM